MKTFQKIIPIEFCKNTKLNLYLKDHLSNYPQQTWQDLYKFVYQGFFGSTHFQVAAKHTSIRSELEKTSRGVTKSVLESLPPEGIYARLNFFPLKKYSGLELEPLTNLISEITSIQEKTLKSRSELLTFWEKEVAMNAKQLTISKATELLAYLCTQDKLPVFHHSVIYRANYLPAYRVVTKKIALKLLTVNSICLEY
ncbi:MAG: hypothetical protein ACFFBD_29440 [Candidatus Hodarchaeota archaeon]